MNPNELENIQKKIWKPVKGYEGRYLVSSHGRFWSLISNKFLKPIKTPWGYYNIRLYKNLHGKMHRTHRIIAINFIGSIPKGKEVHHIDGDKGNNIVSNLKYVTPSENIKADFIAGRRKPRCGEDNNKTKLKSKQVLRIRRDYGKGKTLLQLGNEYGVHFSNIGYIVNRKTWRHI